MFWQFVGSIFMEHWLWILIISAVWIIFELATRDKKSKDRSENGFTRAFNVFVGSFSYFVVQFLVHSIFYTFLGNATYCHPISSVVHLIAFPTTGLALHYSGFWPYLNWLPDHVSPRYGKYKKRRYKRRRF